MKRINIFYWIITGLFMILMLFSAFASFKSSPEGDAMLHHLQIPASLMKLLAVGKILGIIAILIPGYPRLKEWAYAGFFYDLLGALFLGLAAGDPLKMWLFVIVALVFVLTSYFLYHRKKAMKKIR